MKQFTVALAFTIACSGLLAAAIPPAERPVSWVLKFTHTSPKRITVNDPLKGKIPFWYLTYTVTNPFDDAKMFLPEFEIRPKGHKTVKDNFYPEAEKLAEERDGRDYINCVDMRGLIKPGQTRAGIVIFRQISRDTNKFTLVAAGLSAKTVIIEDGTPHIKQKVYQADYYWPGDRYHFDPENFKLQDTRWVKETTKIKLKTPLAQIK